MNEEEQFEFLGELIEVVREHTVRIDSDFTLCYGNKRFFLEEGSEYIIDSHYEYTDRLDILTSNMLVVRNKVGDEPFILPYDPLLMTKQFKDLALIG